jgi:hypothetical protein
MTYVGPEVERNGAICARRVVVQYAPKETDPVPYGITSYEQFVRDAP